MPDYDFCFTGAGCAGLSLLIRILSEPSLRHKKILLVDRHPKNTNDRTWCFWEKSEGFFENLVYRRWSTLRFYDGQESLRLSTAPYTYKMIRGIDFYTYCLGFIRHFDNVEFVTGNVECLHSDANHTYAVIDGRKITAGRIFNSMPPVMPARTQDWRLLQHFKGWVIRSLRPVFDPEQATIMDFRTTQDQGTSFFYVMPFSPTEALVECTFFSAAVLPDEEYTAMLTQYIGRILGIRDYIIQEKEFGVIPMTTAVFPKQDNFIYPIGSAAGLTKASSGYTFNYIQEDCDSIVASLVQQGIPTRPAVERRRHLYDRILLNVLITGKLSGQRLFSTLFTKTDLPDLLAFLDNKSVPAQDWAVIRSLPKGPFLRAALGEILGWRRIS
jgi:lycopene beta-cyclase